MKELYLEIKLNENNGADVFVTDKNYKKLEDQNKLLGQLMFEEPYLIRSILKLVRERNFVNEEAKKFCAEKEIEPGLLSSHEAFRDYAEKELKIFNTWHYRCNQFPEYVKEEISKILNMNELKGVRVNYGPYQLPDKPVKYYTECTGVIRKIGEGI